MKISHQLLIILAGILFVSCATTSFDNRINLNSSDLVTQQDAAVQIPFYVVEDHIFSDWYINGKKMSLMWDTGCTYNILDTATVESLIGAKITPRTDGQLSAYRNKVIYNEQIQFKGTFLIMDCKAFKEIVPGFNGIIGGDLFKNYTVTFDMDKSIITLSGKRIENADFIFTLDNLVPLTPIELNGEKQIATIDTGSDSILIVNANNSMITSKRSYMGIGEVTILGFRSINAGLVNKAVLCSKYTISDFIAYDSAVVPKTVDVLMGLGFFNHGVLVLDYPGLKGSWTKTTGGYSNLEKKLNPVGTHYYENKGLLVSRLLVGSTQVCDIKIGDRVVSVDGKAVVTKKDWNKATDNVDSFQVELSDGTKIKTFKIVKENFQ